MEQPTLSRTVVRKVIDDRVAVLASDAAVETRFASARSVQDGHIRSFMCAPLWNQNEVIGVLYCDNPRSKKFTADDLDVFTALSNYAAVAIEQARVSQQLFRRPAARAAAALPLAGRHQRILQGGDADQSFITQERDVTVMFCDIVGFTSLCEKR